jgi:hypothetical protein
MPRYRLENGAIVDTDKATGQWEEETDWDGSNHISRATGSQWDHETLYRSAKGQYWLEHTSQWSDRMPSAEGLNERDAAAWLLLNDHALPADLAAMESEVLE